MYRKSCYDWIIYIWISLIQNKGQLVHNKTSSKFVVAQLKTQTHYIILIYCITNNCHMCFMISRYQFYTYRRRIESIFGSPFLQKVWFNSPLKLIHEPKIEPELRIKSFSDIIQVVSSNHTEISQNILKQIKFLLRLLIVIILTFVNA